MKLAELKKDNYIFKQRETNKLIIFNYYYFSINIIFDSFSLCITKIASLLYFKSGREYLGMKFEKDRTILAC